jgi:hypothetical protein
MARVHPIVFLVDVDNTLLDNDGIQQDLKDHLETDGTPAIAIGGSWRICSRNSATATIWEPCSAFAPSIHSKWSFCQCPPT